MKSEERERESLPPFHLHLHRRPFIRGHSPPPPSLLPTSLYSRFYPRCLSFFIRNPPLHGHRALFFPRLSSSLRVTLFGARPLQKTDRSSTGRADFQSSADAKELCWPRMRERKGNFEHTPAAWRARIERTHGAWTKRRDCIFRKLLKTTLSLLALLSSRVKSTNASRHARIDRSPKATRHITYR